MVNPYNIKPFFCFENEVDPYVLPWKDDRDMLVSDTRIYASQFPGTLPNPPPRDCSAMKRQILARILQIVAQNFQMNF